MAPPRKGGPAAGMEAREKLTAVVLADSFTQRFRPVTVERAKVLLPLVNVPMLDYTLEWLSTNGVEEVYVFCCAHAEQIQEHLESSDWIGTRRRNFTLSTVVSTNCLSMGDALRLLDQKDLLKNDFILVSGDVVTNMKLGPLVEAHRRRRAADKAAIMTVVMREGMTAAHRARLGDAGVTVVLDPGNGRLLKFEEEPQIKDVAAGGRRRKPLRLDAHLFGERDDVSIRSDLVETGVYLCAPEVLMLFSDNFDYQNVRRDFISGVLSEEELGNKIFVHGVTKEYAARVHSLRSYDAVSRDIMARWVYPLVPDTNLFKKGGIESGMDDSSRYGSSRTRYRYERGRIYLDRGVMLARTAKVGNASCVGSGTSIGEGAVIKESVIGRDCRIGAGAVIHGCYLGAGVVVGNNVVLTSAMLCDGVVVKEGAKVERNSVLSFKVVVDRGTTVPAGSHVALVRQGVIGADDAGFSEDELEVPQRTPTNSSHTPRGFPSGNNDAALGASFGSSYDGDDDGDGLSEDCNALGGPDMSTVHAAAALAADGIPESSIDFSTDVVGPMGAGFLWKAQAVASEADPLAVERLGLALATAVLVAARDSGASAGNGDEDEDASDTEALLGEEESVTGIGEEGRAASGALLYGNEPHFKREVAETFLRCVKENISHDNVVIELNGLKIAEDKTFADCARYMLTTALGLCLPPPPTVAKEYRGLYCPDDLDANSKDGRVELLKRSSTQLRRWRDLLRKFLKNEEDQVELLLTLEEFCAEEGDFEGTGERGPAYASIFPQILKVLYELDVAGEESILQWAAEKEHAEEAEKEYLKKAGPFLEWLQEAEEESSSGEEESSSGEE